MNSARDGEYMSRALQLARKGLYSTHPNPRVGCLLVADNGDIVGAGWHVRAGEPHAEVHALCQAGSRARGATAYVSLEPCSHQGRTPPCADALIAAGVRRVVAALQDPNPQVAGNGLARLASAGIEVRCGVLEDEARALNCGFIKRMERGLPFVRVKLAMSLDGRTAMQSGESQWITGAAARSAVQRLRAQSSVVLSGADTVLLDKARLTVRPDELNEDDEQTALAASRPPLRVLVDGRLRVPLDAPFYQAGRALTVCCAASGAQHSAFAEAGQELLELPATDSALSPSPSPTSGRGERDVQDFPLSRLRERVPRRGGRGSSAIEQWHRHVDLPALLRLLAARGANEVLVEAGASLAGAFARAGLVDEYRIFVAPKLLGSSARPLFNLPLERLSEALALRFVDFAAIGEDLQITACPL